MMPEISYWREHHSNNTEQSQWPNAQLAKYQGQENTSYYWCQMIQFLLCHMVTLTNYWKADSKGGKKSAMCSRSLNNDVLL